MRLEHYQRVIVEHLQGHRQAFDAAGARLVKRPFRHLTFRPFFIPVVRDKPSASPNLGTLTVREQMKWEEFKCAPH
jgi:hypothetical protein